MLRISLPWMIDVVKAVDQLEFVQVGKPLIDSWWTLFDAKNKIEEVFGQSIYRPYLRISREKATTLHKTLEGLLNGVSDNDRIVQDGEVWAIRYQREQFTPVFLSEISTLPLFLVAPKEGYDVAHLIDNGMVLFPLSLTEKVPEAIADANEAGKALAFELGTACGFHVFRVTEAVLKRYWDAVSGKARPNLETLGNYAAELKKGSHGQEKIWEILAQITKLHRNPLIHPEVILAVEEAIEIVGIARSVVGAMLRVMPDALPTESPAIEDQTTTH